jgi:hypothetical protein
MPIARRFQMKLSRRNLLKAALGMPAATWLLNYRAAAVDTLEPYFETGVMESQEIA